MSEVLESSATTDSSYTPNDTKTFDGLQSEPEPYHMSWGDVCDQLLDFDELEHNWDGTGAVAPPQELTRRCGEFVQYIREKSSLGPPVFVTATPDGHISFEWQSAGSRLEAEITLGMIEWVLSGPAIPTQFLESPWEITNSGDE